MYGDVIFDRKVNSFAKFSASFLTFGFMKSIKKIFWAVWRVWFYVVMLIPILIMLPFLVASILTERGYPYFFKMSRIWAKCVLFGMGFYYKVEKIQKLDRKKSYMFVANHTSMTDIMLMLAVSGQSFCFCWENVACQNSIVWFFLQKNQYSSGQKLFEKQNGSV